MGAGTALTRLITKSARRYLVGPRQSWVFERPGPGWKPPRIERTSFYLHVPFCLNACPYCPYTKVPYDEGLVQPYTESAMAEIDWWAAAVGPAGLTSVYIGGGTPTVALDAVQQVLEHLRGRFRVTGDVCIETNPADVNPRMIRQLQDIGVGLVSLGVQSFKAENLTLLGRRYSPDRAGEALRLLAAGGFSSVNVDLMFALPGERSDDVVADLARAAELGATQITAYPLFTFPYTAVGEHLRIASVRMPNLRARREQYRTIHGWCGGHGFSRVSVWGFRKGAIPRYSSVTRDGYIGVGPGAGSLLPGGFSLNTFDLDAWLDATSAGLSPTALWLPFLPAMSGWWWLYWRLYETRVPVGAIDATLNSGAAKARLLLAAAERLGLVVRRGNDCELTEPGAFWIHLMQNHFALNYVNAIWTRARLDPWPDRVAI